MKSGDQQISAHDLLSYRVMLKLTWLLWSLRESGLREDVRRCVERAFDDVTLGVCVVEENFDAASGFSDNPTDGTAYHRRQMAMFDRAYCLAIESLYCSPTVALHKRIYSEMPAKRLRRLLKRLDDLHNTFRPLHPDKEYQLRKN